MARRSPAQKIARLTSFIRTWERMRPAKSFHGRTLAHFKRAVQPSFDTRSEIAELKRRLRDAIARRDAADFASFQLLERVVFCVIADPEEGDEGELYVALGYVPKVRGRRRASRPRRAVSR